MSALPDLDDRLPLATDGEIAAHNLETTRHRAWARFAEDARLPGAAEAVVDHERLTAQFLGDLDALDRLETLALEFELADHSFRSEMVHAEVASMAHRFQDARDYLARAESMGAPREVIERNSLTIDQACGVELDRVRAVRRRIATASGRLEDLVPLGAVLADLERVREANTVYQQALDAYDDVSPFPLAWVCFQLGVLWGELATVPNPSLAALWYRRAVDYVPGYVKARVHLAEIHAARDEAGEAEKLLRPALSSRDPEVHWRLADTLFAQERFDEAATHLDTARAGFEQLLAKHRLAFVDHAAEFYAGSGADCRRALELARENAANRPTRRAIAQVQAIAARCS